MTVLQMAVTLAGVASIAWINWYFFAPAGFRAPPSRPGTGVQRFTITVDGGYDPAVLRVQAGRPVRLEFHRVDDGSCTEEIVLGEFNLRKFLPSGKTTAVEFTPQRPGSYLFTCGMGMVHGRLEVNP
jgi:plastocyanin domain-containing protein